MPLLLLNISEHYFRLADAFVIHEKFLKLGKKVEDVATLLKEIRDQQGYSTNPLQFIQGEIDRSPLSISSLGKLESAPIKMDGVTNEENKRLAMVQKIRIQIVVHYNDIFVLRTQAKNLVEFMASFKQKYFIKNVSISFSQVHSPPLSITISIVERYNRRDRVLAVIGLALPQKFLPMSFANHQVPQGYPVTNNEILRGFVEVGVTWMGEGGRNEEMEEEIKDRPFSLFIPECELDEFFYDESIGFKLDDDHLRDEPISPIGMRLRLERERNVNKMTALNIRKNLLDRMENRRPTVEDIVREEQIPSLSIAIGSLFGPADVSRKLKPMRKDPTRTQTVMTSSYRLVINIQSSRKLPPRKDGTNLRPFVAITVNGKIYRTPTANGANANWQHTLIIEGEGSRSDISAVSIQVFDEVVQKLPQDNRLVNTRHEESLHNILGSSEICSSTFIARSKVDAFIKLKSPIFSSSYNVNETIPSYLKVLIALEPATVLPSYTFPSQYLGEPKEIISQCLQWTRECSSLFSDRDFISTIYNVEGKSLLATRFLRPLNAPPSIDAHRSNPTEFCRLATRAVSLIPFLPYDSTLSSLPHLWCSTDQVDLPIPSLLSPPLSQFLSLEYGTREEHGVLLACWCLSLSLPVSLLLGRSTAENSSIVMVELPTGKVLLNPEDGSMLSCEDEVSSFSVHTLITPSNIYANLQSQAHTAVIHFDITRKDAWRPLFDKEISLPSVQPQSLNYSLMEEDSIVELRSSLERALKLKVDESRSFGLPQWNLLTSRTLRESINSSSPVSSLSDVLSRSQSSFVTSILVLSTSFTSISDTVEQIITSRVHLSAHPQTQFALSVSIDNVFNTTVSITLALAVLTPTQNFVP
uniref:Mks-6 n=1 Tax=Pristionchus pacificus TaxID=54126 RepID=A0A2A6C4S5_PRIPA|eukprot:PDM73175.1 mks-6 [Pristionchus pacificus]